MHSGQAVYAGRRNNPRLPVCVPSALGAAVARLILRGAGKVMAGAQ